MVEVMTPFVSVKQLGEASSSSLAALSFSLVSDLEEVGFEAMSGEVVPMLKRRMGGTNGYVSLKVELEVVKVSELGQTFTEVSEWMVSVISEFGDFAILYSFSN